MDTLLNEYHNPSYPACFGGVKKFSKHANIDSKTVSEWLKSQNAYTLHKHSPMRFRRRKTYSSGIDDLWQADLTDLSSLANHNDHYRYLLTRIDVFSRVAAAIPLKNKSGSTLTEAFSRLIENTQPTHLQTDKGTEFLNTTFQKLLRDRDIKF
jgi:transposase InsO family protein